MTSIVAACLMMLTCLAASARAQVPSPAPMPKMEFDAVIAQAVAKNLTLARAATTIQRADALLAQSKAVILPFVNASVTNVTLNSARGFSGTVTAPQNQLTAGASAGMSVLNTARWAQVQQARDQVEVAQATVAEIRQQVVASAADTYLAVIAAHRQLAVSERALESAQAHLDYATKRLEGGAGSRLNQLRAAQVVSSEQARIEAIRLALRAAQEALGVIVAADGPVDVGADPVFDMTGAFEDTAWRTARPDLITEAAIQRAAERVVRDSWKDWMPIANAQFDPAYVTPASIFTPSGSWRLTLSAVQPIYDGGQRKIALRQREITLDQSKISLSETELRARSEVRLAQEALRAAERAAQSANLAAQQTSEVLRITTTAFELGATTNLEVIDAQRSDLDAKTTAELAEGAVRRAKLELLVALGRFK